MPISVSGRCRLSCISTTLGLAGALVSLAAGRSRASSTTLKPLMRCLIFTVIANLSGRAAWAAQASNCSVLAVVAFFQRIEQVGGGVHLAVVLHLFVTLELDHAAVLENELVQGLLQIGLLDQHALESGRVEAEGGATLEPLAPGVAIDVLERLEGIVGGHVGGLGDRGVDPLLRGGLDVDVLGRGDVVGGNEVFG